MGSPRFGVPVWLLAAAMTTAAVAFQAADPAPVSSFGWATDGSVQSALQHGDTLYVGGRFTRVAPVANMVGGLVGVLASTGAVVPDLPRVQGVVRAMAPDAHGGLYLAGDFAAVDGHPQSHLARISPSGVHDPTFAPVVNGQVYEVAVSAAAVFIRGAFSQVNGESRFGFAVLDPVTGATLPWPQSAVTWVHRMAIDGDRLILLGDGPVYPPPRLVAAVDVATGAPIWSTDLGLTSNTPTLFEDLIVAAGRIIVTGQFRRPGVPFGISNLLALDAATGTVDPTWAPFGDGSGIIQAAAAGATTLYVGGWFESIGGQPRRHAAAIDIATGQITPWNPRPDANVTDIAVAADGTVYLVGVFDHVDDERRHQVAAVDPAGQVLPWRPDASAITHVTVLPDATGRVLLGTVSGLVGGTLRTNVAAFDSATKALHDWAPVVDGPPGQATRPVTSLAAMGDTLYMAGQVMAVNGAPRGGAAAVSTIDGSARPFDPSPTLGTTAGFISTMLAVGDAVYVGGTFDGIGGLPAGLAPRHLARVDPVTGAADPAWRPSPNQRVLTMLAYRGLLYIGGGFGRVAGVDRLALAAVDIESGALAPWNPGVGTSILSVRGLVRDGQTLYFAGIFSTVGGQPRNGLAAVDAASGTTTGWVHQRVLPCHASDSAIAAVDGQVVLPYRCDSAGPTQRLLRAFDSIGAPSSWTGSLGTNVPDVGFDPGVTVTATDIVAFGSFTWDGAEPGQGVATFARQGSSVPMALESSTGPGPLRLQWQAPTAVSATGYLLEAGTAPGSANLLALPIDGAVLSYETPRPRGGPFFVRVRARLESGSYSAPSNEIAIRYTCAAPPPAPTRLAAGLAGNRVTLSWTTPASADVTGFLIEAGSAPGLANLARLPVFAMPVEVDAPAGTYFVRVRAANDCGAGAASDEIRISVDGTSSLPAAPATTSASVLGSTVQVTWSPVAGATSYVVEAGFSVNRSDAARLVTGGSPLQVDGVPRGVYSLRVRAVSAVGMGPAGPEVSVAVP